MAAPKNWASVADNASYALTGWADSARGAEREAILDLPAVLRRYAAA